MTTMPCFHAPQAKKGGHTPYGRVPAFPVLPVQFSRPNSQSTETFKILASATISKSFTLRT